VRSNFAATLRCAACGEALAIAGHAGSGAVFEGALTCPCGAGFPVIAGVPRILPIATAATLVDQHPVFFQRFPALRPPSANGPTGRQRSAGPPSLRSGQASRLGQAYWLFFATSASLPKASASRTARSARIFRLMSTPPLLRPATSRL